MLTLKVDYFVAHAPRNDWKVSLSVERPYEKM